MKSVAVILFALLIIDITSTAAFARGGGSNILNSPGYQRRLQESRGQVPDPSISRPYTTPPSTYPGREWRARGRR